MYIKKNKIINNEIGNIIRDLKIYPVESKKKNVTITVT